MTRNKELQRKTLVGRKKNKSYKCQGYSCWLSIAHNLLDVRIITRANYIPSVVRFYTIAVGPHCSVQTKANFFTPTSSF